jgi:hypothetical protein
MRWIICPARPMTRRFLSAVMDQLADSRPGEA